MDGEELRITPAAERGLEDPYHPWSHVICTFDTPERHVPKIDALVESFRETIQTSGLGKVVNVQVVRTPAPGFDRLQTSIFVTPDPKLENRDPLELAVSRLVRAAESGGLPPGTALETTKINGKITHEVHRPETAKALMAKAEADKKTTPLTVSDIVRGIGEDLKAAWKLLDS
ncbi:hypothetical protein KBD59_01435 [Candidatus Gracilibacteria bacterium]|nr:hypothetical protein [Candidatus Gracilibacteria bacterium]